MTTTATWLQEKGWAAQAAAVVGATALLVLSAQVVIPLQPVPITMQPFAVLLLALVLGSRLGTGSVALYLAQGAIGLPVFAQFRGGLPVLAGPTGGYLVGFLLAAALVGWLWERAPKAGFWTALAASVAGVAAIYLCGAAWLAVLVGPAAAVSLGILPFLGADLVKAFLAAGLAARSRS